MRRYMLLMIPVLAMPGLARAQSALPASPPQWPAWAHRHPATIMQQFHAKFVAANTTHDGRLTLAQAKAANLKGIEANFNEIDAQKRGYITFNETIAWQMDRMALKLEAEAAQLRAAD